MMHHTLIRRAAYAVFAILVLHLLATTFYWYVSISWYDMMMHTLGGVFLALFAGALFTRHIKTLDTFETIVTILLFVLIIGLGWEYFEYVVQWQFKGRDLITIPDSISDMICDMIGGSIGAYMVLRVKKGYTIANE